MSPSASRLLEISDRRDQMVLTMAVDAARVKAKSREARHKKERQVVYRGVRYQRFNGRREDVMQEEVREAKRARRAKSIQRMTMWLEAQDHANAEEGSPRTDDGDGGREGASVVLLVVASPVAAPIEVKENVEWPEEPGQQPITSFFAVSRGNVSRVA